MTTSGVFMPTAQELATHKWASDIVKARFGFQVGTFERDGKKMHGCIGYLRNEFGEIEWDYTEWEDDPGVNVLEPVIECHIVSDINVGRKHKVVDEDGIRTENATNANPYGALARSEFLSD